MKNHPSLLEELSKLRRDLTGPETTPREPDPLFAFFFALEGLSEMVVVTDLDHKIVYVNAACRDLLGYDPEELMGLKADKYFEGIPGNPPDLAGKIAAEASGGLWEGEIFNRRKDGDLITINLKLTPLADSSGKVLGYVGISENITKRKQAEKTLRASEERFRRLFSESMDVNLVIDAATGVILEASRTEATILGYKNGCLKGKHFNILLPSASEISDEELLECIHVSGSVFESQDILRADGTLCPMDMTATIIPWGSGKSILATLRDITERKKAEEARALHLCFLENMERVERAIRQATDVEEMMSDVLQATLEIFEADRAWLLYPCDPDAESWSVPMESTRSEYPGAFVLGEDIPMLPEAAEIMREALDKDEVITVDSQSSAAPKETDRRFSTLSQMYMAVHPQTGNPWIFGLHQCSYHRDWTDGEKYLFREIGHRIGDALSRLLALRDLRESEAKYRRLAENSPAVVFQFKMTPEGAVTFPYINETAKSFAGVTAEDVMRDSSRLISMIHPYDLEEFRERVVKSAESIEPYHQIFRLLKDGKMIWVEARSSPEAMADGSILWDGVFIDITERKLMEEEILKARKLESLGTLAGGIAHDFNNILAAILGNVSYARIYAEEGSELYKPLVEAEAACLRAQGLTQQLLTFSRGGKPVKDAIRIGELLKETTEFSLHGSNVSCRFKIARDLWPIEADRGQIGQVINNLIINADQAMPEGGEMEVRAENVEIKKGVMPSLEAGRYVKVEVEDEGVGIPVEHLEKIFDPYFTTKQKGSGLGLASIYSIVINHSGAILAVSEPGKGSTFIFHLPASKEEPKEKKVIEDIISGEGRVLLMDDEDIIRDMAVRLFAKLGYEVETAVDGKEAVEKYREARIAGHPFGVVILDLTVKGGMGGEEALERLKEIDPEVKAIVSSGYSIDSVLSDYQAAGFSGMIAKPYSLSKISRVLRAQMK
jgi:PAS domain S-box-containing protein